MKRYNDLEVKVHMQLMKEKQDILALKVSQLGLKPGEEGEELPTDQVPDEEVNNGIRFAKLNDIDLEYANYKIINYNN